MQYQKIRQRYCLLILFLSTFSLVAQAGPMGFQDSWMVMGDMNPNWREFFINYAFTPRDAIGLSETYMRSDDKQQKNLLNEATYTRLVKRWNGEDSQANVWFVAGIGQIDMEAQGISKNVSRTMITPGLMFDYETTRVYFSLTERLYRADDVDHDYHAARAGFSFYESGYDETQPWLILEARKMDGLSEKTEITPMLRFINKSYFIEFGVNNSQQIRGNFMLIL